MQFKLLLCLALCLSIQLSFAQKTEVEWIKSAEEKKKDLPFSDAVRVGKTLFLAGQIGMDHKTRKLAEGGIQAETAQALQNIEAVLQHNGSSMDHVIKCTVILADIEDFKAMNEIYKKHFKKHFPARTTFSAGLVAGAKIEIECIAVLP